MWISKCGQNENKPSSIRALVAFVELSLSLFLRMAFQYIYGSTITVPDIRSLIVNSIQVAQVPLAEDNAIKTNFNYIL